MIAIPIAFIWIMLALTLFCWNRALRFGRHSEFWAWFTLAFMAPAAAIGTTVLAAWLS